MPSVGRTHIYILLAPPQPNQVDPKKATLPIHKHFFPK